MASLALDTFTDPNGTALASHGMDVGPGWTVHSGTWVIWNGGARLSSNTVDAIATVDAGVADVVVGCTMRPHTATNRRPGVIVRFTDSANFWCLRARVDIDRWDLDEVAAGVRVTRATHASTIDLGTSYAIAITASGSSIGFAIDGGGPAPYASATHNQGATRHGIYGFRSEGDWARDDFQVSGEGGSSPLLAAMRHHHALGGVPL